MPLPAVLPKVCFAFLFFFIAPASVGWRAGRGGHGKLFVRVFAGISLLTGVPGSNLLLHALANPAADAPPPGNDFAIRGGQYINGGLLVAAAVLLAIVACAGAIGQARIMGHRGRFILLAVVSAFPLALSVTLFVLDFLQDGPNRALLLGSFACGVVGVLAVAAYAFIGLVRSGSRAFRSSP